MVVSELIYGNSWLTLTTLSVITLQRVMRVHGLPVGIAVTSLAMRKFVVKRRLRDLEANAKSAPYRLDGGVEEARCFA